MKFMGDMQSKNEIECVTNILKVASQHGKMADEAYCQIIRQVTDNSSVKRESCERGWRLLSILCTFCCCSDVLHPYVQAYIQQAVSNAFGTSLKDAIKEAEEQLKITLHHGARRNIPMSELKALLAGHKGREQTFILPATLEMPFTISTRTMAGDVIAEMCSRLGLTGKRAHEEYSILSIVGDFSLKQPIQHDDYMMDIISDYTSSGHVFKLWIKRVIWFEPLTARNSNASLNMHYHQVSRDFMRGNLLCIPRGKTPPSTLQLATKLAVLQYISAGENTPPSISHFASHQHGGLGT
uniref:MyTH4 domain-containing protein n=1 Tax=Eptatretus burgeri TaxID=7764 RepID=A0A8C4R5Z7_EPTBU